ncbi:serine hydrolase [Acidovorax sp. Leaf76]|uniref:serine hydrolase domain-containing protein n=1 Tax=unclassified Acidovorax TaxID=2684926 RepID=UPI0007012723|nr:MULTISPECIES: serine hydrolase [unclassified Acidovorax]KQO26878.1 serine hydrolase [Acidovorax sp. Leaf76]KQO40646.1 serine hydrolase [Acidovorax sp. Leaf84]KQS42791.1 serine hydrolase [Acidovorax sp. Leaf191]
MRTRRWPIRSIGITVGLLACLAGPAAQAQSQSPTQSTPTPWRETSTPEEQALDAAAFEGVQATLATPQFADVDSAVVVLRGRVVYRFYRDGEPDKLRDTQSASKSALSALLGTAIAQGRIASVDQRVVDLVPEWAPLNPDPRAATITLRNLLTLTAGFALPSDPRTRSGNAPPLPAREAWARPLVADPGQAFAYDNSVTPLLAAVLEKATGMPLPDYAHQQLVGPMGWAAPRYQGSIVHLRTQDMAKLGQLYLQRGQWDGKPLVPEAFADASVQVQNTGGPPVGLSYGYLWWVVPGKAPRPTFMASGFGGQFIWVYPPMDLVVATTSTVSAESGQRGQALQWIRHHAFAAAQRRVAAKRK